MKSQEVIAQLEDYARRYPNEQDTTKFINFIRKYPTNFSTRKNLVGHLTSSAWITTPDRSLVLLIHHEKLNRWLQPGGHIDETDESLVATALREVQEETGIKEWVLTKEENTLTPIFDLDVHPIPARGEEPEHLHYDIRFHFITEKIDSFSFSAREIREVRWFSIAELQEMELPLSLERMWRKA